MQNQSSGGVSIDPMPLIWSSSYTAKWEAVTQGTCMRGRQLSLIKTPLITLDYTAELPKKGTVSATAKNARFKGCQSIWTGLSHVFTEKFNGGHLTSSLTWEMIYWIQH